MKIFSTYQPKCFGIFFLHFSLARQFAFAHFSSFTLKRNLRNFICSYVLLFSQPTRPTQKAGASTRHTFCPVTGLKYLPSASHRTHSQTIWVWTRDFPEKKYVHSPKLLLLPLWRKSGCCFLPSLMPFY